MGEMEADKIIMHCDLNNFYASVECMLYPELNGKPVAVCGDPSMRHGIVLAKNTLAKLCGVKTGDVIYEAAQKCPDLVVVKASHHRYIALSEIVREIYRRYSGLVECFGIDECWIDVTDTLRLRHKQAKFQGELSSAAFNLAEEIRQTVQRETGLTISIGVSWNKIFAKIGSDLKKPNATTLIDRENYEKVLYSLPASELLYVGKATKRKLAELGVCTIGDIARSNPQYLKRKLGKWGEYLHGFALGIDSSYVRDCSVEESVKSVGNSITTPRDLVTREDILIVLTIMAESVSARMREQGVKGRVVSLSLRNNKLDIESHQTKLSYATNNSTDIIREAERMLARYNLSLPIRSLGVSMGDLVSAETSVQLNFFQEIADDRADKLENVIDVIRQKHGHAAIQRGLLLLDNSLQSNPKSDNVIHPFAYFKP